MIRHTSRMLTALAAATLVVAGCGDDDESSETETPAANGGTDAPAPTDAPEATTAPEATEEPSDTDAEVTQTTETTEGGDGGDGWAVSTDDCIDPDAANEPIEGPVNIATAMPLSGGPAAAAFSPVGQGFQAYIDYANEQGLLPDHELSLTVGDDQYDPALTPGVVNSALDNGAHLFSGIIGTPNNLAVRDVLNEECVPQLLGLMGTPASGEVESYPWTTGGLLPFTTESAIYAEDIAKEFPDGASVALFYANNDAGQLYRDAFQELAPEYGFTIVDEQSIEGPDTAPPTAQVNSIAGNAPDVIMAAPLGAQCATFMNELANAKAVNTGWEPRLCVTNTCAIPLLLAISGPAAGGLFTSQSGGLKDIGNPDVAAADPEVTAYIDYMNGKGLTDIVTTAAAGWTVGEVTVEILRQAAQSTDGLTRASIINASRRLDYAPSMARDGITYKMDGDNDAFYVESSQIVQYDAETTYFTDIGELITSFESS